MKKVIKRGLSIVLTLIIVMGMLPVSAFAAVDSSGRPKDVNNKLILSIYTGEGFPGEPAVYSGDNYKNISSSFRVRSGATFASSAKNQLNWTEIQKDIVQGTSNYSTSVWGVYDTTGLDKYFLSGATILQPKNEAAIIRSVKNDRTLNNASDEEVLEQYEIVWYVIKLQHSRSATEWHIDGVIKEKQYYSINYYGNGNTSGSAPLGTTTHPSNEDYTVLDQNTLKKEMNGAEVRFLGWSARADGSGAELAFYQPGDVITAAELQELGGKLSLYAMWDTTTQHTATVNNYLDGNLTSDDVIHGEDRTLSLSADGKYFYDLTESETKGVYTTKVTGNGKFHLYLKDADGSYAQVGTRQLTIYNQNGSLDIHHYSVTYDLNGGNFAADPGKQVYFYGEAVTAIDAIPTKDGYRFLGWETAQGNPIQPGGNVTASITAPVVLKAKWEKTVSVTINVKIDHNDANDPNGYDKVDAKDEVFLWLVSRENSDSPYLEVPGKDLSLSETSHTGFIYGEEDNQTTYTANGVTFADMPGGTVDYTVVASKSGYDTTVKATKDSEGNWTIDVEMVYKPTNFDLEFTVEVDESVPSHYVPSAAIVKVTFWSNANQRWETITQQEGSLPGVRLDFNPDTRTASGHYPVWKYESAGTTPYGYRIQITSFVYPDGTIVPASEVLANVKWSDNVYTATMSEVIGGAKYGDGEDALDGAYFADASNLQNGKLHAVITMDLHDVIFDANDGKINGSDSQTVKEQYRIPGFKDYIPVREGGYIFDGWYEDQACTKAAVENADLTTDIILYAKWIAPLTISGTVTVAGTYRQNDDTVSVNDIDRATEAVVVLQELRNGTVVDIDSATVSFGAYEDFGSGDYRFSGIPNDGKKYQIHVLVLNYGTTYDNESDVNSEYSADEYQAVFGADTTADVDALLTFIPPSYNQTLRVDATQIGEGFRPSAVLSEVMYRDTGDNHAFQRISQHNVEPYGVQIALMDGTGSGIQSIWKWHTNGTLYDYQMNISKVDGVDYDSDTAPYYINYAIPAYWNESTGKPTNDLLATLIPKQYPVTFDLNAGTDTVTGMDDYKIEESYTDEEDNVVTSYSYQTFHTWSYDTAVNAVPVREDYVFLGWQATVNGVTTDSNGNANISDYVCEAVTLTALWEKSDYTVTTDQTTGGTTSGGGKYTNGATATVIATVDAGYLFKGWFEEGVLVSEETAYSFTVTSDRTLVAKFAACHSVTTIAENGGTVSGGGLYESNATATITATPEEGYYFAGWYDETGKFITANTSYSLAVLKDSTFTAKFVAKVSYQCDYVYIFGYTDTEIGATGPLLRGELAQMIYRLVKQEEDAQHGSISFNDTEGKWFKTGISYMAKMGAIDPKRANANPYVAVTRGETYKMICLGLEFTADTKLDYSEYAAILRNSGYLTDDGRVTEKITRWEFCELFNAILGRANYCLDGYLDTDGKEVTAETYGYQDLKPTDSYYRIMMIATSTFTDGKIDLNNREQRNDLDEYGE